MATNHDDDTMPEETQGYKLSQPKQSLAQYTEMGEFPDLESISILSLYKPAAIFPVVHLTLLSVRSLPELSSILSSLSA
jgi:hypothetical protein